MPQHRPCLRRFSPIVLLLAFASMASGAEITFSGYTNGCFGAACSVPDSSGAQQTASGLTVLNFNNSAFSGTTSGGSATLNAAGVAFGGINSGNLGAMSMFAIGSGSFNGTFRLSVTFTLPFVVTQTFDGAVTGTNGGSGNSTINFNNTPVTFTSGGTSYTLTLNDVSLLANGPDVPIVGTINVLSVDTPEPASIALVGLGLLCLATQRSRRWLR